MKKIVLVLLFLCNFSHAGDLVTYERDKQWVQDYAFFSTYSFLANSYATYTFSGMLDGWSVEAVGADATFEIRHTTVTRQLANMADTTGLTVHVSSVITVRAGTTISDDVRVPMFKPTIIIRSLGSGGTAYTFMSVLRHESDVD